MSFHGVQLSGLGLLVLGFSILNLWVLVSGLIVVLLGAYIDLVIDENSQRRMPVSHRAGSAPPPCPRCGKPLEWLPETSKYSCPVHGLI